LSGEIDPGKRIIPASTRTVVTAPPSAAATGGGALPDTAATGVTAGTSSTSENGIDALGA